MSKSLSLKQFSRYIAENVEHIGKVRREVAEIQVGFNSAYVEWKAQHDAALERLVEAVTGRMDEAGPDLRARIEERIVEEQRIIAERRQELQDTLIPETQAEADRTLQQGQELIAKLRKLNPRLDKREEKLKAQGAALEGELDQLNGQIRRLSGCLGVVFNFFKIGKLDRQRQQVIGQLKVVQQELKKVRDEWQESQGQVQSEQDSLQAQWQELTLKLAQLQGELEYLDAESNREALALRRAIRYVIDHLEGPIPSPASDIKDELDRMVELNVQTDDYQEGLGSVGSLLSVLDGITEGLSRFGESVEGLIEEQRMHSAHLPDLDVTVPDKVRAFHAQWDDLAQKVRDDGRLCANPAEFLAIVRPVMEKDLSEARIKAMFDGLGQALDDATGRWR
jgi:chromosome segregation ATPase